MSCWHICIYTYLILRSICPVMICMLKKNICYVHIAFWPTFSVRRKVYVYFINISHASITRPLGSVLYVVIWVLMLVNVCIFVGKIALQFHIYNSMYKHIIILFSTNIKICFICKTIICCLTKVFDHVSLFVIATYLDWYSSLHRK